ncbi:MAG: helix-turn-helix domain-containing protein [Candidatus Sumerlaeota bacterium]|nr:helix-turn-helix domain-containing protein [Candidatus Sumerlaeota bacterium]
MTGREQMLRVPRVAVMLDVCKKRVYHLIQEGKLEIVKLGPRQTRILKDSYDQYIEHLRRQQRIARGDELPEPGVPDGGAAFANGAGARTMSGGLQLSGSGIRAANQPSRNGMECAGKMKREEGKRKARRVSKGREAAVRGRYVSQLKSFFCEG